MMMVNCEYIRSLGAASRDLPVGALYSSFVTMMPALAISSARFCDVILTTGLYAVAVGRA